MKKLNILNGKVKVKIGKKTVELSKKVLAMVLAALLVLGGGTYYFLRGDGDAKAELITARVTRGDIDSIIEGTGVIQAINQYEVTSLAKGDIIADYFEEGDYVEKDQLLYEMDSSSVSSSIERARSSLERAQMSYDQSNEDVANLNVKADVSGVITELNVKKGDQVSNNSVVAKIIDNRTMLLNIPFNTEDAMQLSVGQGATVMLENSFTTVDGTVTAVATGSIVNTYGVAVTNVEIEVTNPGSIMPGDKATVIAGDYACNDAGEFEYKNESTVTAKVSGKAVAVNYRKGDKVSYGDVIVKLESDSATNNARTNRLSLNDATQSLADAQETLEDYRITAPIAGKVIEKNAKAGEKLDQNSSATMAIIADLSSLIFEMSIDELDISKIKVGQQVDIVADAMDNRTFTGTVTSISIVGTSSQGVTSYPVKVTIENGEESGLIPGMNVTGNIVVESVSNVLRVPVSAVRRGNLVIVKDDGTVAESTPVTGETKMPMGEVPNGEMPNGNMPNGNVPGGNVPNGNVPGGNMPSDSMPQGEHPAMPGGGEATDNIPEDGKEVSLLGDMLVTTAHASSPAMDNMSEEERGAKRLENMIKQLDVPDGYTVVQVQTGLSNDTFIEIKSGLSEGQTVLLPDTTQTTEQNQWGAMGGMPHGMPTGMGGGMPGGMPGGMSGGMRR
ncbi:MAG: HlyD family efflux transporter periplasmic adaptor subunit [Ruminococcaceae bacterium]|nr:HlyD family efflux transporter periplasmic adaptor subunit [Oscillospiraceae bacterium]